MRWLVGFVSLLLALGAGCENLDECEERGLDCNDHNECTSDGCAILWCVYSPVEDGTSCVDGVCISGRCVEFDGIWPCTEGGIRHAIAVGGGPHTFDCSSRTPVVTQAEIEIDNDVILDGEGNLIVDASGGHRVFSVAGGVTAELRGVTVTGGAYEPGSGGGIRIDWTWEDQGGTLTLIDSTVSGNTARNGGGIESFGTLTLINSTVSGNTASYQAGGILNSNGTLTLISSTVSGNTADSAVDGIANSGAAMLTSTLVDGDCEGDITSNGYNIESPGNTCGFDETKGDKLDVTETQLNLGPLADNGGPTMTHALGAGSVAIDVIPEAECEVDTDQRGFPRDSMCDVGAFEVQL